VRRLARRHHGSSLADDNRRYHCRVAVGTDIYGGRAKATCSATSAFDPTTDLGRLIVGMRLKNSG
jgi:hypothetical protein